MLSQTISYSISPPLALSAWYMSFRETIKNNSKQHDTTVMVHEKKIFSAAASFVFSVPLNLISSRCTQDLNGQSPDELSTQQINAIYCGFNYYKYCM